MNDDGPGVLILSEFAGSAQSLSGAIRVNPWNTEELANAIHQSLTLSRVERELRQHKLYRLVGGWRWGRPPARYILWCWRRWLEGSGKRKHNHLLTVGYKLWVWV